VGRPSRPFVVGRAVHNTRRSSEPKCHGPTEGADTPAVARTPGLPTDHELMERVRDGDELAFEVLFRRYDRQVYAYVWRKTRGDHQLAADVVQETFFRLWRRREHWMPTGSVRAYLLRTAQRLLVDEYRRQSARARWKQSVKSLVSPVAISAESEFERHELRARIAAAIEALPDRTREVFILKHHAGLSYREIADFLGIANKTVEAHMGRALRRLREALQRLR